MKKKILSMTILLVILILTMFSFIRPALASSDVALTGFVVPDELKVMIGSPLVASSTVEATNAGSTTLNVTLSLSQTSPGFYGLPDTDGDGWVDYAEMALGSNPSNSLSTPESWMVPGTSKDGMDNDKDGWTDRQDLGTAGEWLVVQYPEVETTPIGGPLVNQSKPDKEIKIDSALGRGANIDWGDIVKKAKEKGFKGEADYTTHRRHVRDSVIGLNKEDVWVFHGHTNDKNGDGVVDGLVAPSGLWGWGEGRVIDGARLKGWLSKDSNPPSLVVLVACKSRDLFSDVLSSCSKVVVGFSKEITLSGSAAAAEEFLNKLLDGGTINEALAAANAKLAGMGIFNPHGAQMVFDSKIANAGTKKLDDILKDPPSSMVVSLQQDTDGDGIDDEVDDAIYNLEDFDGFEDDDGFPEPNPELHHAWISEGLVPGAPFESNITVAPDFNVTFKTSLQLFSLEPGLIVRSEIQEVLSSFVSGTFIKTSLANAFTPDDVNPANNEITKQTIIVSKSPGVGGIVIPVDKFGLLAPYIGLASTIIVATVATAVYVKRVKHRKEKQ